MKNLLLILPVVAIGFTGCVAYQPSPVAGQYGYTYDYQLPIAEGLPAPTFSGVPEPRRTSTFVAAPVVADVPPAPPVTPPIVSSIPEMTPRPIIQNRSTTTVYPQQPAIIREGAGANIDAREQAAPAPAPGYAPGTTVIGGGLPVIVGNVPTNQPTNTPPTNDVPTNQVPTNVIPTNNIPTNGFNPAPGTNINEGAGAETTNNVPQRIDSAQRLPAQTRIQQGQVPPSAPSPNTLAPGSQTQQPQTQSGTTQPVQQPFAPVAPAPGQTTTEQQGQEEQNQGTLNTPAQP